MTEEELAIMRIKLRLLARDVALECIVAGLRKDSGGQQALSNWANQLRTQATLLTIAKTDAAMSDLTAAEWREALEEMLGALGL